MQNHPQLYSEAIQGYTRPYLKTSKQTNETTEAAYIEIDLSHG